MAILQCLQCCTQCLTTSNDCPCCYNSLVDHISSPSTLTMSVLGSQSIECGRGCNRTVHVHSQCQGFFEHSTLSPSRTTIQQLLAKGQDAPTTPTEKRVAEHLLKRLMAEKEHSPLLQIPTRGQLLREITIPWVTFEHLAVANVFDASESMQGEEW